MSSSQVDLVVDWCSYEAAKYAVEKWHYSKSMPVGKLIKIGAWEDGQFIGCVLFSNGSSRFLGTFLGLEMLQVTELARVALNAHRSQVTAIIGQSIKMLRGLCSGLRLIVSFADPDVGHLGIIYQAGNWVYCGRGSSDASVRRYKLRDGRLWQWRSVARFLNHNGYSESLEGAVAAGMEPIDTVPKYKYLYPLDRAMRRQIAPLAQPYPKHAGEVSKVTRPATSGEGQVQALPSAS